MSARLEEPCAADVMARKFVTAAPAARRMLTGGFHHLPVIEDGRPVGIVGLRSVVSVLHREFPGW